jgi:hypothetical protein
MMCEELALSAYLLTELAAEVALLAPGMVQWSNSWWNQKLAKNM